MSIQVINKHEASVVHFNEMGYQNEVYKTARPSRNVLTVRNIVENLGRRYIVLMDNCQEMRIIRPKKLSFC